MTDKLTTELQVLLPSIADEDDGCVKRLLSQIGTIDGVRKVHVKDGTDGLEVCVHFAPGIVEATRNCESSACRSSRALLPRTCREARLLYWFHRPSRSKS